MNNLERFALHVAVNTAFQGAVLALLPVGLTQHIFQLVFLVCGLAYAYLDEGAPLTP